MDVFEHAETTFRVNQKKETNQKKEEKKKQKKKKKAKAKAKQNKQNKTPPKTSTTKQKKMYELKYLSMKAKRSKQVFIGNWFFSAWIELVNITICKGIRLFMVPAVTCLSYLYHL